MKKLSVARSSNANEEPKETLAPEEDPEQNMELDLELIDREPVASASDTGRPERQSIVNILWENTSFLSQSLNDRKDSRRKAARTEEGGGYL